LAECSSPRCSEEIDWAYKDEEPKEGETPKRNPINRASVDDPAGNLEVWRDEHKVLRYRYLRKGEVPAPGHHRGISHYATCVDSESFRRRRTAASS
jgi:hypothetical protein